MVASTVPTVTVSPSGTTIPPSTPAAGAGTSVSTLSVRISSSGSSASTEISHSDFSHFVTVPSDTETPIWGITTSTAVPVAMGAFLLESVCGELAQSEDDVLDLWQEALLERR